MKILRLVMVVLFAATTIIFLIINIINYKSDNTLPVIDIVGDLINVSLGADTGELMQGVTAYDENDGDITHKVIVESISRFIEPGVSIVTYAVCDNDNHVAIASRKIIYTDYVRPRFTLKSSLIFNVTQTVNILNVLGATDLIDGNISGKVIISANDYTPNTAGLFYISAKAANSKGDIIYLQLPIYVEDLSLSAPNIELREYLTYLNAGQNYNIEDNLISALSYDSADISDQVIIDTDFNPDEPGIYQVHYYALDAAGRRGHSILTLIVED